MQRPRIRRWIAVASVLALVAGAVAYLRWRPTRVTAEPIVRGRAVEAVYATGTVEPRQKVIVKARVGEHVASIHVREGEAVELGQLLARIEDPVREAALAQGRTQLEKARALAGARSPQLAALEAQVRALRSQLELARIELGRSEQLFATGAVPRQELDTARARVAQLEAQTRAAAEQARTARVELGATAEQLASQVESLASEAGESEVRAPIAGVVLSRHIEPGEVIAPNQPLFEIADTGELIVELKVDEADIARVRDGVNGSKVALAFIALPDRAFSGQVAKIQPEPDRVRRSYTVEVRLDAPIPELRVGMTAEANLVVQRKDGALLVPAEAVQDGRAWFVEDGRAVPRQVELGIRGLTHAELVGGAAEGELVIVDAAARRLAPGDRVRPTVRRAR